MFNKKNRRFYIASSCASWNNRKKKEWKTDISKKWPINFFQPRTLWLSNGKHLCGSIARCFMRREPEHNRERARVRERWRGREQKNPLFLSSSSSLSSSLPSLCAHSALYSFLLALRFAESRNLALLTLDRHTRENPGLFVQHALLCNRASIFLKRHAYILFT